MKLVHVYSFVKYIGNGRTLSALCMQCVCACLLRGEWSLDLGEEILLAAINQPRFHRILQLTPIITDITKCTDTLVGQDWLAVVAQLSLNSRAQVSLLSSGTLSADIPHFNPFLLGVGGV